MKSKTEILLGYVPVRSGKVVLTRGSRVVRFIHAYFAAVEQTLVSEQQKRWGDAVKVLLNEMS